jgi:biopolymer transport protein ExbB
MEAFLEFITRHWYFAIPMFLMSLVAVTLVIWRIMLNINAKTDLNEFLPQFQQRLEREGPAGALNFCRSRPDYIPRRLFVAGLESSKQGLAAMRRSMASVIELEIVPDLNFLLAPILAIAKIATMVGLLGTVISMIFVFNEMGTGSAKPETQGRDIGLALFATALGLMTAIPLVFSHVLFKAWIARFEVRMKSAAQKLLVLIQAKPTPKAAGVSQPTPQSTGVTATPATAVAVPEVQPVKVG